MSQLTNYMLMLNTLKLSKQVEVIGNDRIEGFRNYLLENKVQFEEKEKENTEFKVVLFTLN